MKQRGQGGQTQVGPGEPLMGWWVCRHLEGGEPVLCVEDVTAGVSPV